MSGFSILQIHRLYSHLTSSSTASVEWAWLFTRIVLVTVIVAATYATFSGFDGLGAVPLGAGIVILYSAVLAWLLKRGYVGAVFLAGFLFDNLVVGFAWWQSVDDGKIKQPETDLWLALLPLTIVGIARIGPRVGMVYTLLVAAFLVGMTLGFEPADSYAVSQVWVRTVFLGAVGILSAWLVAGLNRQRQSALKLQVEAETFADISQLVGASLDPQAAFPAISNHVRALIPYEMLILARVDEGRSILEVVNVDYTCGATIASQTKFDLTGKEALRDLLQREGANRFDVDEAHLMTSLKTASGYYPLRGTQSVMSSTVASGDDVVGILIACTSDPKPFESHHQRKLARLSEIIGGSMTRMQVYAQSVQLAGEREARLSLDVANRKLEADFQAQELFLSAVSHELRTPLTSIIAFNDILLGNREQNLSDLQKKHLGVMQRNGRQLATIVDDLLELSRTGYNRIKFTPEELVISEVMEQIAASISVGLRSKQQRLIQSDRSADKTIIADRQRLHQVASNLLSNASKYSPNGSDIEMTWSVRDGMFEMSVRDHGSGISGEEQVHLFQPFFRSGQHRADNIPGTGLGLVISKNLVKAHGGRISLKSSQSGEDQGTTVCIRLPVDGSGISGSSSLDAA